MIKKIFCITLISLGSGLGVYFYVFRFLGDGLDLVVSILAAIALEMLLAFAAYKKYYALACVVIFYAVIQTSAGQTFALLSSEAEAGKTNIKNDIITEYKKNIERLNIESDTIVSQMQSLKTAQDRANYNITISSTQNRLNKITEEKINLINKVSDLSGRQSEEEKNNFKKMSVYDFYYSMSSWSGENYLKFIFHIFFSLLISIMSPIGIITYNHKSPHDKKIKIDKEDIKLFCKIAWYKITNKTGAEILSEIAYNDKIRREGLPVKDNIYATLYKEAVDKSIITINGTALIIDAEQAFKMLSV